MFTDLWHQAHAQKFVICEFMASNAFVGKVWNNHRPPLSRMASACLSTLFMLNGSVSSKWFRVNAFQRISCAIKTPISASSNLRNSSESIKCPLDINMAIFTCLQYHCLQDKVSYEEEFSNLIWGSYL